MAARCEPPIIKLPDEILLLIASQLPDSGTPQDLKNLSLVSRKFQSIAQETLYTIAKLPVSCGCHPKVNAALKLLRTLFSRPDLASKVRVLRFRTARKNIAEFYEAQDFDLTSLRDRSLILLRELGYEKSHPWWRSIENAIESAFAGLLLLQLPNLVQLDFMVKDHHRGPPSSECITGLFGTTCPPAALAHGWRGIKHLTLGDTHMLKCGLELPSLTSLDLKTMSISTVLRLNGPGSLQGTERLRNLALACSIQFADRPLVEKADIQLSSIFDALGCQQLSDLKIQLINDGYHIDDDILTPLDTGYFMDQLCKVQNTLESLTITFEMTEDESEIDWLVDMCTQPKESLRNFTSLKRLIIPQVFLFVVPSPIFPDSGKSCQPKDLPEMLESLEMLYPHEDVEQWAIGFLDIQNGDDRELPNLREIVLTCRPDVGMSSEYFTRRVERIWWTLMDFYGINTFIICEGEETRESLADLFYEHNFDDEIESGQYEGEEEDEFEEDWEDDNSDDDDDDDDMPDLIDPMD